MGGLTAGGEPIEGTVDVATGIEPDFATDLLPAAFRLDNPISRPFYEPTTGDFSLDLYGNLATPNFPKQEGYNVYQQAEAGFYENLLGYEDYLENFIDSGSPEETEWIKAKIERERADRDMIAGAGARGFGAVALAGLADPVNFIPVAGTAVKGIAAGRAAKQAAAATARAGFLSTAVSEGILQTQQETRTLEESATALATATILSGVLGGAVGLLSAKQHAKLLAEVEDGLRIPKADEPDHLGVREVALSEADLGVDVEKSFQKMLSESDKPTGRAKKWEDETAEDMTTGVGEEVANSFGTSRVAKVVNPALRVASESLNPTARTTIQELVSTHWLYAKNLVGGASRQAVDTLTRLRNRELEELANEGRRLFVKMRTGAESGGVLAKGRIAVTDRARITRGMNYSEFLEQAGIEGRRAEHAADVPDEVIELGKQYRKKVFEPMLKELKELEIVPQDLSVETADFYLNRLWNKKKIQSFASGDDGLRSRVVSWLREHNREIVADEGPGFGPRPKFEAADSGPPTVKGGEAPAVRGGEAPRTAQLKTEIPAPNPRWRLRNHHIQTDEALEAEADEIIDRLKGIAPGRVDSGFAESGIGRRTLTIPDDDILDFLDNNIEEMARAYTRTVAPIIELKKKFPSVNFSTGDLVDEFAAIRKEGAALEKRIAEDFPAKAGETAAKAKARQGRKRRKVAESTEKDIDTLRKITLLHLGRFGAETNANPTKLVRAGRVARNLNVLRLGGEFALSSTADLGAIILSHGFANTFKHIVMPAVSNLKSLKASKAEIRRWGVAAEQVFSRSEVITDAGNDFGVGNAAERFISGATRRFFVHSLQTPWNESMKMVSGLISHGRMLDAIDSMHRGKVSKVNRAWLARLGIDEEMAGKIRAEWKASATQNRGGVRVANTDEWADREVAKVFKAAGVKDVEGTIVTPGIGQKPFIAETEMGKHFFQFKTFFMTSTVNYLMQSGQKLRMGDLAAINGQASMMAMGLFVYVTKQKLRGKEISENPAVLIGEAIDRSGGMGFMPEVMGSLMRFAGLGDVVFDGEELTRFARRDPVGAITSPTIGAGRELAKAVVGVTTGDLTEHDIHRIVRFAPYRTHPAFRWAFDRLEKEIQ